MYLKSISPLHIHFVPPHFSTSLHRVYFLLLSGTPTLQDDSVGTPPCIGLSKNLIIINIKNQLEITLRKERKLLQIEYAYRVCTRVEIEFGPKTSIVTVQGTIYDVPHLTPSSPHNHHPKNKQTNIYICRTTKEGKSNNQHATAVVNFIPQNV